MTGSAARERDFSFKPGHRDRKSTANGSVQERVLDVKLLHNDMEKGVYAALVNEFGSQRVGTEQASGVRGLIDVVVNLADERHYYEIKTSRIVKDCIRDALGQLLEYAYWPTTRAATSLTIVGRSRPAVDAVEYMRFLRERFGLPLYYRRYDMASGDLEPPV